MLNRRAFAAALAAAVTAPRAGWAAAGAPAFLAAARHPDGGHWLHGVGATGESRFALPLPERGHAAAAHPTRPLAVAFARRPGFFALVIDCAEGRETARFAPPPARDFAGHGAFSRDGGLLYTVENAHDLGEGRVGVWETAGWTRVGEVASGGIGPHDARLSADGSELIVANGGILTHPDSGRAKLNLATMRPNVVRIGAADGALRAVIEPEPALRLDSLRHLALRADGLIAVAAQWEGDLADAPPLLALLRPGADRLDWLASPHDLAARGYAGSVAFSGDGTAVAFTSPRGGLVQRFEAATGAALPAIARPDASGIAAAPEGFVVTDGAGGLGAIGTAPDEAWRRLDVATRAWDNHLVAL